MGADGLEVAALGELGEAVAEVSDAREDELLLGGFVSYARGLVRRMTRSVTHLSFRNFLRYFDPFYIVAKLLNGIDEGSDVASDVVE